MKKTLSIVLICGLLITMGGVSVFASNETIDASRTTSSTSTFYSGSDGTVAMIVSAASLYPYISASSFDSTMHRDVITVNQEYIYMIRMYNTTNNYYVFNRGLIGVNVSRIEYPSDIYTGNYISDITDTGYSIKEIYGSLLDSFSVNTAGLLWGYVSADFQYNNMICLPPHSSIYSFFSVVDTTSFSGTFISNTFQTTYFPKLDRYVNTVSISYPESASVNNSAYLQNADVNSYYSMEYIESSYNELISIKSKINSIDSNVQSILNAYTSNSQNAQNVTSNTQSNEQTLSNIGTNEDTWFSQNNQALQATGITNFNYTPTVMSGMSVISDQFNQLWIAIGDWNFVYTFSMMLGLVVLILRHNPQRKKSSSNSSGGGKSNATSS